MCTRFMQTNGINMSRTENNKNVNASRSGAARVFSVITGILGTVLIILVIVAMIPLFAPKLLGYGTYDVVSGSMEPEIPVGSLVLVKETAPEDIAEGDVIAFSSEKDQGVVVTHRVIEINSQEREFITKGDANELRDMNPVPYSNLVGRVEKHYPKLGSIMASMSTLEGKLFLTCFLAAGVLLNYLSGRLKDQMEE